MFIKKRMLVGDSISSTTTTEVLVNTDHVMIVFTDQQTPTRVIVEFSDGEQRSFVDTVDNFLPTVTV